MPLELGVQGRLCLTDANPNREAGTAFSSKFKIWPPRSRFCATPGRRTSAARSSVAWAANRSCSKIPPATPSNSSNRHGNKPPSRSPHDETVHRDFHQPLADPHLPLVVEIRIWTFHPQARGDRRGPNVRPSEPQSAEPCFPRVAVGCRTGLSKPDFLLAVARGCWYCALSGVTDPSCSHHASALGVGSQETLQQVPPPGPADQEYPDRGCRSDNHYVQRLDRTQIE